MPRSSRPISNGCRPGASRAELVGLREELRLDREIGNLREAVAGARDGAERVRDIVEDLRRLSAEGTGEGREFDLAETARIAAQLGHARHQMRTSGWFWPARRLWVERAARVISSRW
jgi:hypothetical protein